MTKLLLILLVSMILLPCQSWADSKTAAVLIGSSIPHICATTYNACTNAFAVLDDKGVSGNTTTQVLARFDADVVQNSVQPKFVVIQVGVNDLAGDVPLSTMQSNIISMVSMAQAANIVPVLATLWPWKEYGAWSEARQSVQDAFNAWLSSYALANKLYLFDAYATMESPADTLNAIYDSGDHLHPNAAGCNVAGTLLWNTIPTNLGLTYSPFRVP